MQFQRELRKNLVYGAGQNESEDEIVETQKKAVIAFLSEDNFFNEIFDSELSHLFFKPLRHRGIDTLEKLLLLRYEDALRIKHVGRNTLRLFRGLQEICSEIVTTIDVCEIGVTPFHLFTCAKRGQQTRNKDICIRYDFHVFRLARTDLLAT
ncbi:MAG: hypothetical protein LJE96_06800 [Deltaproteobacteria bacterium]|nr:hypothetical protein [Deltaproteobacteria bacterium]